MKKSVVTVVGMVLLLLIAGCLDYKAYDIPKDQAGQADLVDEIAQVERELGLDKNRVPVEENTTSTPPKTASETVVDSEAIVEEEVILPELTEEDVVDEAEFEVITVKENEVVKLNVKVVDPDQDTVSYTFSKPLNPRGEWKTNYGDAGEYAVTVIASDGVHTTEKKVNIIVQRVNVPPIISPLQDIIVNEGEPVKLLPLVSDPNKDEVTVTISEPLKEGLFETDHTSAGQYQVSVIASDGELQSEAIISLTVNDVNELPVIASVQEQMTVKEGETVMIKPKVSDLDDDPVVVTISDPVGDDGTWETGFTNHGEYFVTVIADDGKDKVTKKIRLVVEDVNMPPQIVEISLASG